MSPILHSVAMCAQSASPRPVLACQNHELVETFQIGNGGVYVTEKRQSEKLEGMVTSSWKANRLETVVEVHDSRVEWLFAWSWCPCGSHGTRVNAEDSIGKVDDPRASKRKT